MPSDLHVGCTQMRGRANVGVQRWRVSNAQLTEEEDTVRSHVRICTHARTHTHTHTYVRTYVCIYARTYVCTHAFMRSRTRVLTRARALRRRPSCETGHHRENPQLLTENDDAYCYSISR